MQGLTMSGIFEDPGYVVMCKLKESLFPGRLLSKVLENFPNFARIPGLLVNSDGLPAGYGCVNGHLDMISTPTEAISLEQL